MRSIRSQPNSATTSPTPAEAVRPATSARNTSPQEHWGAQRHSAAHRLPERALDTAYDAALNQGETDAGCPILPALWKGGYAKHPLSTKPGYILNNPPRLNR